MVRRAVALVAASQASFVGLLGLCVALRPGLALGANEGGVSNYGVHAATVLPYSLAYALSAVLAARAARLLSRTGAPRGVGVTLTALAVLLTATLLTTYTYKTNPALKDLHFAVGAGLVLFQSACAPGLARRNRWRVTAAPLVAVTGAGLVACVLATTAVWHILFAGQALVVAGFAPLLVGATAALD
ncbi:MAG: hypothetical protein ACHQFZ_02960 [Acidimicrobiales bacterium]